MIWFNLLATALWCYSMWLSVFFL